MNLDTIPPHLDDKPLERLLAGGERDHHRDGGGHLQLGHLRENHGGIMEIASIS